MNGPVLRYSIVRILADSPREILVPIGVVVEFGNEVRFRFIEEVTPQLRALSHPSDWDTALAFGRQFSSISNQVRKDGRGLSSLAGQEWGGFIFDRPKEMASSGTLDAEADFLFREFVAPRHWRESIRGRTRLSTQVRRVLRAVSSDIGNLPFQRALRLEVGVEFRAPGLEPYQFDGAVANGLLTLLKAVDLSVQPDRQRLHIHEAIAESALVERAVDSPSLFQVAVINPSAAKSNPANFVRAIQAMYGRVFEYPEERRDIVEFIVSNAQEDVAEKATQLGLSVGRSRAGLYLESRPVERISRGAERQLEGFQR